VPAVVVKLPCCLWALLLASRSFKNYVINNFKNKSKLFVFTYKFFALAYFEGAPGAGNLNAHAYKNIQEIRLGNKYCWSGNLCCENTLTGF
jgi:hypothetical protein